KQRRGRFRFTREYGTRPRRCEEPLLIASPLVRALQCGKAILAERLRVIFFDHHEGLAALNEPPEDRVVDGAACLDGFLAAAGADDLRRLTRRWRASNDSHDRTFSVLPNDQTLAGCTRRSTNAKRLAARPDIES